MVRRLLALGLAASWVGSAVAQNNGSSTFQWGFTSQFATQVTECQSYSLNIIAKNGTNNYGQAPYYMIAWPVLGVPTVTPLGSSLNLSYTVNQPAGTEVLFTVADALGNSGGETSMFTVESGDTGCLPSKPSVNVTLATNRSTSDDLNTCDPLGLRVYGGQEPYNLSFAATNSPVVTNVTLGSGNDVFTWPNRADPGGQLIVSVVDANGVWGTSTGAFKTAGSSDTGYCPINPSAGNHADVDQNPKQPSKSNVSTIVPAVVVPIVVLGLLAGIGYWLWRRRQMAKQAPEPAFMPDAWTGPNMAELQAGAGTGTGDRSSYNPYDPPPTSKLARFREDYARSDSGAGGAFLAPGMSHRTTSFDETHFTGDGKIGSSTLPPGAARGQPEVIYHSDAGAIQEVPPPYIDRSGLDSGPSVLAPAELLSNATSVTSEPEPQSSDTKHVYTGNERASSPPSTIDPNPATAPSPPLAGTVSPTERPTSSRSSQSGFRNLPEPPRIPTDKKGKGREVLLS